MDRISASEANKNDLEVLSPVAVNAKLEERDALIEDDMADNSESSIKSDALGGRALAAFLLAAALLTVIGIVAALIYVFT